MLFRGRVAIVTGSGRGIGRAVALGLAREGAAVLAADIDGLAAEQTAAMITVAGGTAVGLRADVTEQAAVEQMVETAVRDLGRLDYLVNNAGVMILRPFLETNLEEWNRQIDTNLRGTYLCSRAAAPRMIRGGGGAIVNFSSGAVDGPPPGGSIYAASKAGIRLLTAGMAVDLAARGIRVNAVAPGYVKTEMTRELAEDAAQETTLLRAIPLKRAGQPDDVVGTVLFLLSDTSSYITGTTITIDGGLRAHG